MLLQLVAAAAAAAAAVGGGGECTSALDCSLNGDCVAVHGNRMVCVCDPGWVNGDVGACELLNLGVASLKDGYNHLARGDSNASTSSWGGTQVCGIIRHWAHSPHAFSVLPSTPAPCYHSRF